MLIPLYLGRKQGADAAPRQAAFVRDFNARHATHSVAESAELIRRLSFGRWTLWVAALLVLLYVVAPLDIIPDSLGIVGLFDDLVLAIFVVYVLWLLAERARARI